MYGYGDALDANGFPTGGGTGSQQGAADLTNQITSQTGQPMPAGVGDEMRQFLLAQQAGLAGKFADQSQQAYQGYSPQVQSSLAGLRAIANGQNSVSAEQLRQGMQQSQAQQMSMAAGASPQNAGMAARTAMMNASRQGMGLAGQQAVAGLQERNQAMAQYGNLLQGVRGQDLSAAMGARQSAEGGYGSGAYGSGQPSVLTQALPVIAAGASLAASDRRLKTDVKDGSSKAEAMLEGLRRASTYRYKDSKQHGEGEYVGPMAQDLERAGSRSVIDTPGGKMVHGARLATENTAMLTALRDRVAKLEGSSK